MNLYQKTNMRIEKIASNTKYRDDDEFPNLTIIWESA